MDYPYELHRVPGEQALARLEELRARGGGVPVILGDQEAFERIAENMEFNDEQTPEQLVEASRKIDVADWLREREEEDAEYYDIEPADWPDDAPVNDTLTAHCDVATGEPFPEVLLTVLPAAEPWMAPCYLKAGGWNEMPGPAEQAAMFRHWAGQYGAVVACISDDVIEFTVARPPRTREDAMALARQQYVYCADIVDQGVGSLEALAATLLGAGAWYFWWD